MDKDDLLDVAELGDEGLGRDLQFAGAELHELEDHERDHADEAVDADLGVGEVADG